MNKDKLLGAFYIVITPIVFLATVIWYLLINQPLMILIIIVFVIIYVAFMSDRLSYGSEHIRKVQVPNATPDVEKLLKTTSLRGELVYAFLLSAFNEDEKLSQTDLVSRIKDRHKIALTHQAIRPYIVRLEDRHLIHSPKPLARNHVKEYDYALTEQGRWCSKAVRVCFPQTNVGYIWRHFLGCRKLPTYPSTESSGFAPQKRTPPDVLGKLNS